MSPQHEFNHSQEDDGPQNASKYLWRLPQAGHLDGNAGGGRVLSVGGPHAQYQQSDGAGHYYGVLMTLACTVTRAWKPVLRLPGFLGSTIRLLSASILQSKILNSPAGDLPCQVT